MRKLWRASLADLGIPISVSHEILPEFREYERGSTVLINAYLAPKMQSYLTALDNGLKAHADRDLFVMQSSGGIMEPRSRHANRYGRFCRVQQVAWWALRTWRRRRVSHEYLTFDMGGTSTDVALLNAESGLRTRRSIRFWVCR